jgi:hypothetical protein
MTERNNKIMVLHPSLDIQDNVLTVGFSEKEFGEENKFQNKNHHLIAISDDINKKTDVHIIQQSKYEHNGKMYMFEPNTDNKERRLVKLNERWSRELLYSSRYNSTIDKQSLYYKLKNRLKAHVKLENEIEYNLIISWIIMTYFYPIFPAIPYLHIKAVKGSGKTTTLDFIKLTAFNGSKEIATVASMRDKIDGQRSTFIIDQADNSLGTKSNNAMVDIFTDSYKKSGGKVSKMVEEKRKHVVVDFDTYCPKAFASIRELNQDLRDRCIQIQLIRSKENLAFLDTDSPVWLELRNELYKLLISNFGNIKNIFNELNSKYLESNKMIGRKLELWLPIETIMNLMEVDEETITESKNYFLEKSKDTEARLSHSEWLVIDKILSLLQGLEHHWLFTNDIAKDLEFENLDEESENILKQKNQYVGNIIKRLNLASKKDHTRKGNTWLFEKARVENIRDAYSGENTSHPITTEKDITNVIPF